MRASLKQKRAADKAAEWLAKQGVASDVIEAVRIEAAAVQQTTNDPSLEASSVLLSLHKPELFESRKCQNCGNMFATNYRYVTHCSDRCTALTLEKYGLQWDAGKTPRERWGSAVFPVEPPQIIGPEAYSAMLQTAKNIIELLSRIQTGTVKSSHQEIPVEIASLQTQIESLSKDSVPSLPHQAESKEEATQIPHQQESVFDFQL